MKNFLGGLLLFAFCFGSAWGANYRARIKFTPASLRVGENHAAVFVEDSGGRSAEHLAIYLRTSMPGMEMPSTSGVLPWPGKEVSPGHYDIPFQISMLGLWQLDLLLQERVGSAPEKIYSVQQTVKPESHRVRNIAAIFLVLFFVVLLVIRFPGKILTPRTAVAVGVFLLLVAGGFVYTNTLKKSEYPGQEAYDGMGMKMDMNAPDMGMSTRILSAPQAVSAERVKPGEISQTVTYPGAVQADLVETVYPRVEGWLLSMPFYPGMNVRAGETIGRLDTTELQANTEAAREKFAADVQEVKGSRLELQAMENKVKEAKASLDYWKAEIKREAYLVGQGAISKQEYDEEKSQYLEALSRYNAALDDHRASVKNVARIEAISRSDYASFQATSTVQNYTVLTSRISGVVTKRLVNEGVLVNPGMGILEISKIDFIRLQAHVAESDLDQIEAGTPVIVRSPRLGNRAIQGHVTSIFHETNLLTHTGTVEARIANPNQMFFPGDYVTLTFVPRKKSNVLTVAASAVQSSQISPSAPNLPAAKKEFVWVVDSQGLAHRRFVTTGISNGERTEITSGLKFGDEVIDSGVEDLQEMSPVSVVKGEMP